MLKKLYERDNCLKAAVLAVTLIILFPLFVFAGTITVNTAQKGKGRDSSITLREALEISEGDLSTSELTAGELSLITGTVGKGVSDTINFNISGEGPHIIQPVSVFPNINDGGTLINGYSQPGASYNTSALRTDDTNAVIKIEIDGTNLSGFSGISIYSSNNEISGLSLHSSGDHGIFISGASATGNHIWGNYIGTDSTGLAAGKGNTNDGIILISSASDNIIGTDGDGVNDIAERNIISGNGKFGVDIFSTGCNGNKIAGNFIGTDATGKNALGNGDSGINIINGPQNNIIGTEGDGSGDDNEGNVLSGNKRGLFVRGSNTSGNIISGNYIGVDVTGTSKIGNSHAGIFATDGTNKNTIGYKSGMASQGAWRNVISGNGFFGILLADEGTDENSISGNYIGTSSSGDSALGNGFGGVALVNGPSNNVIGGGTGENGENLISGNDGDGISLEGSGTKKNSLSGNNVGVDSSNSGSLGNSGNGIAIKGGASSNTIESNTVKNNQGSGIKIVSGGNTLSENVVTSNDGEEIEVNDSPNNPLPPTDPPAIINAVIDDSGMLNVKGTSDVSADIELFAYPDGNSDALEYLGKATANKNGKWSFSASSSFVIGDYVFATATGDNGTSPYSPEFRISSPGLSINLTAPFSAGSGDEIEINISYSNSKTTSFSEVFISFPLPVSTTFVSASDLGVFEDNVITWEVGAVAGKGSGGLSLHLKISDSVTEGKKIDLGNYSIVSADSGVVYGNDLSILISKVSNINSSFISVKDINGGKIKKGDTIRYEVYLVNKGSSSIDNLSLSTFLPEVFQTYELYSAPGAVSDDSVLEGAKYFLSFSGIDVKAGGETKIVIDMTLKDSVKKKKSIRAAFTVSTDDVANFFDIEAPKIKVGEKIPKGSMKIIPSKKVKIKLGEKKKFKAFVKKLNLKRVIWEVKSGDGTIEKNSGLYKAPVRGNTPQKVRIKAYSVYDPSVNKTAVIKINPVNVIMKDRKNIKLKPGKSIKLHAKVKNSSKKKLIWKVNGIEGGSEETGTISSKGVYTMPSSPSFPFVTIRAESFADSTHYAKMRIRVK